jgi:superfamily II DNA or RNA helicase
VSRALRDYQADCTDAVRSNWKDGILRPAFVLPTGTGKTDCIADLLVETARAGDPAWALAHRGELLDQIAERCKMHAPEIPVGRIDATEKTFRRPIVVASIDTLRGDGMLRKIGNIRPRRLGVDECHHAAAPGYMKVLTHLGSFDDLETFGATATMVRGDKRGLGDVWHDPIAFERDIHWAIDKGWLIEPIGRVVVADHVDLNRVKTSQQAGGKDYAPGELGEMVAQDADQIVAAWIAHARERLTVAFCPSIASSQALAAEFRRHGIAVGEVYGTTPPGARRKTYDDLGAGRIRVLLNCMVATEGWDCPPVSCILQCRPTKLPGLYTQMVGRGLRPAKAVDWLGLAGVDKVNCLVLDVVGASHSQRLVTLIDLHKSAKINTDELDELPCEVCGGYDPKYLATLTMHDELGDGESFPCECEPVPGEPRDPNGGRRKLIGPATYEDLDLFGSSSAHWLFSHQGVRFLPCGDEMVYLWPDAFEEGDSSPTFSIGHGTMKGAKRGGYLDDGVPHTLEEAKALAERYALAKDPMTAERGRAWHTARVKPTDGQIGYALSLGIDDPERFTKGALADQISIALASKRLR